MKIKEGETVLKNTYDINNIEDYTVQTVQMTKDNTHVNTNVNLDKKFSISFDNRASNDSRMKQQYVDKKENDQYKLSTEPTMIN